MMLLIQDPDAYYFKICLKNKQIRSLEKKVASLENSTTMKVWACNHVYSVKDKSFLRKNKMSKEQKDKGVIMSKKYDYLVVGAGLYGAVFAHEAKEAESQCW